MAHAAPVATTAGSNLTGYNGAAGSVAGNNWNNAMNPRSNSQPTSVKADYGNCNSVILRCATPKCSGGGCSDINVAKSIVAGCVSANSTCKKHGDALIDFVAAQLVSDSVAAQNKQAAAAQAAQAAAEQNSQAMQQQMASMQQQMQYMQEQNNQQINSLQQQLAESQRATENAVAAAAENAARAASTPSADTGLTAVQENAVKSGVDAEVVQRATISGQVLTNMEGVESSLDKLKTTMRDAFRYAGCNEINGDNCEGPKRVKKFRELANKFFEPYEALEDNLEEALAKAQSAGIDLGNIYMYFSGSCNRWAEYVCRDDYSNGAPRYSSYASLAVMPTYNISGTTQVALTSAQRDISLAQEVGKIKNVKIDMPQPSGFGTKDSQPGFQLNNKGSFLRNLSFVSEAIAADNVVSASCGPDGKSIKSGIVRGGHVCAHGQVIPPEDLVACTINRYLDPINDSIEEKVLNPYETGSGSVRVGCASDISERLFNRRRSSSKGKSGIDIDLLQMMINQHEGSGKFDNNKAFCGLGVLSSGSEPDDAITALRGVTVSKTLKYGGENGCCSAKPDERNCKVDCYDMEADVEYVDPIFALCDTHAWNIGKANNENLKSDTTEGKKLKDQMNEIIGLKTTVIAQQMYKQYTTLDKMIKQIKIMLEKEVLKANLQVAGGASSSGDSAAEKVEFENCSAKGDDSETLSCLRGNLAKYTSFVTKKLARNDVRKQMVEDADVLDIVVDDKTKFNKTTCSKTMNSEKMDECYKELQKGIRAFDKAIRDADKPQSYTIQVGN